nr:MAG TPA: hypothetical protein [Caudoviricetes sp.]
MGLFLGEAYIKLSNDSHYFQTRLNETGEPTPPTSNGFKFGDRITLTNTDASDSNVYKATIVGEFSANGKTDYFAILDAQWRSLEVWTTAMYPFVDTVLPNIGSLDMGTTPPDSQYTGRELLNKLVEAGSETSGTFGGATYPVVRPRISATYKDKNSGDIIISSPNAKELQMIYDNRNELDKFDETLANNPNFKLADWSFNGANMAWSSDELNQSFANCLNSNGKWNSGDIYKSNKFARLPIIEIPKNYKINS